MMLPALAVATLAGTGLCAAWLDLRSRRLPNALAPVVAGLGLAVTASTAGWTAAGSALIHASVAMVIGMALYSRGIVGGGDVKYYAAVATWFPLASSTRLLGSVSLAGLGLVAIWFLWQRTARHSAGQVRVADHNNLPFGVAIAAGALLAAATA